MGTQSYQPTLGERCLAELVGAFLLTFVGGGVAADVALLHRNAQVGPVPTSDLVLVALAHGLILFVIVMVTGRISGAHANPAVTISLATIGQFKWSDVPGYIIAQVVGSVVGALAILIPFGRDIASVAGTHLGRPELATNTGLVAGLVAEGLGAGILVITIVALAADKRAPVGWAGLGIGLALAAVIMIVGPVTGAAVNPARAFGPDVISIFFGAPSVNWIAFIVCYLIAPILGGIGAAWLYARMSRLPRVYK
ncbi:MAG TPA: aquaporin [Ktedonobacterales bacterium]|nr:aquaporin [Ktedonobacterales bacterium]